MALNDINFQEGEGQDYILELPYVAYTGTIKDVLEGSGSSQYPVLETPEKTGGGNIFIMSE